MLPLPAQASYSISETIQFTTPDSADADPLSLTLDQSIDLSNPPNLAQTINTAPLQDLDQVTSTTPVQDLAQAADLPSQTDPELGTLRMQPVPDPDLAPPDSDPTSPESQGNVGDPELGELRLQEVPELDLPEERDRPRRSRPSVYLTGGIDFLRSDNIFSSQVDAVGDSLFIPGISIYARPQIAPDTYLVASAGGYLVRYVDFPEVDYNELRFRLGIRHRFSSQMYGEVSWINTQLFDRAEGDRFLDNHSLRLFLFRSDAIAPDLYLESFYRFRVSLANPERRNRISNSVGAALVYDIAPDLDVALDYRFAWTTFTEQERDDFYNELVVELFYDLSSSTRISAYGGFSFGESTRSDINFDSGIFGIGINFALPLF